MGELQELAREIGAAERTLRRAVRGGAVRCRRPGPRRLDVPAEERRYLREHWELLASLRAALRTESNVRLAVLFGSAARGDHAPDSDLDLLVALRDPHIFRLADVSARLSVALDRPVELVRLEDAEAKPPLLAGALREGRPIVDRDRQWAELRRRRTALDREVRRYRTQLRRSARAALDRVPR